MVIIGSLLGGLFVIMVVAYCVYRCIFVKRKGKREREEGKEKEKKR